MKNVFKKILTTGLVMSMCLLMLPVSSLAANGTGDISDIAIITTDVSEASSDTVLLGIKGKYITDAEKAIQRINEIRKEACDEGVINPRTNMPLTPADYVPIKWSGDLEYIARIRAAESSQTIAHSRTNGEDCFSIASHNGISSGGEVLAWNWSESMLTGIEQWYEEKNDWVNKNEDAVTGHYTLMIDPQMRYIGLGTFCTDYAEYYNTTAGEFSSNANLSEAAMEQSGDCIQVLEIKRDYLYGSPEITGEMSGIANEESSHSLTAGVSYPNGSQISGLYYLGKVTWTSENEDIASVDKNGLIRANSCGSTVIKAVSADGLFETEKEYTVNHVKYTLPAVAATCTKSGLTEGSKCSICGKVLTAQEKINATGHSYGNWVVTKAATCTKDGSHEKVCASCGDKVSEVLPATGHKWNSEYTVDKKVTCKEEGSESIHCSVCGAIKEGSARAIAKTEHAWDAGKITKEPTTTAEGVRTYTCTACGQTKTESIPKIVLISIEQATVSGVTDKTYSGKAITQSPTIKVGNTILKADADYTVSYKNNTAVGVATITITGKGNYTGTISKTFRIQFKDVTDRSLFYYDPIYWAVDNSIVAGWADGTFRPMNGCNRAAVVTFLWRMEGKPQPKTKAKFKDMTGNPDFDNAISWASENGIVQGWADNTFRPWQTCNRAAIVTFLWRYAGKPSVSSKAVFKDMTENSDFDKAISWAASKGITTGWDDGTFRPWNTCNRLAIVSFLNRYDSNSK